MKFDKDKQEGAQWFAAPQTLKNILEAALARVSSLKGQVLVVQHLTMYDGVFEKAWSFTCLSSYFDILVVCFEPPKVLMLKKPPFSSFITLQGSSGPDE